jgi:hypothetical protein
MMHCDRKRPYKTPEAAARAARGRVQAGAGYLRVYECPECGMYHMTHLRPEEVAAGPAAADAEGEAEGRGEHPTT